MGALEVAEVTFSLVRGDDLKMRLECGLANGEYRASALLAALVKVAKSICAHGFIGAQHVVDVIILIRISTGGNVSSALQFKTTCKLALQSQPHRLHAKMERPVFICIVLTSEEREILELVLKITRAAGTTPMTWRRRIA